MKNISLLICLTILCNKMLAQAPAIQWQKCLGGTGTDVPWQVQPTADGGFIVCGSSGSNDGQVTGHHGVTAMPDCWIVKLDAAGLIEWQKSYGGSSYETANSVLQTPDGGYIFAGGTYSSDGDVTSNHGGYDFWVVKLNDTGAILWQKTYGGSGSDEAYSIVRSADNSYVVAGYNESTDGQVTGHHGIVTNPNYWIIRINDTGALIWQRSLGGSQMCAAFGVDNTHDGGIIAVGYGYSNDGDITGHHGDSSQGDIWVVKLDGYGSLVWEKSLGGTWDDEAYSIQATYDGGYIIGGISGSSDGDITDHIGPAYDMNVWMVKINDTGAIEWSRTHGGSVGDMSWSVQQTSDSCYVVAGYTQSNDIDVSGNHGISDYWVLKMDDTGAILWQKCLGGTSADMAQCVRQTYDGFIVAGRTISNDSQVSGNHGNMDYWVVKLRDTISHVPLMAGNNQHPTVTIFPNPTSGTINISGIAEPQTIVYNTLGQIVITKTKANEISVAELPTGLYLVRVFDKQGNLLKQEKVVKTGE